MKTIYFIFLSLILNSTILFAHGEDKPGPHGGYIRMPGNFHTEVVKEKTGYRVYLLDINWKNPTVLDSALTAHVQYRKMKTELSCLKESNSYICNSKLPQKGILKLTAKREGQTGAVATYNLPLKFEVPKSEMPMHAAPEHQGH